MKPAQFEYHDPRTVDEAVALLKQYDGEAKVLAGGQSLVPLLNMRLARPAALVDINRVAGLDYIHEENGALVIGAMTRQRTLEQSDEVRRGNPLLHAAVASIGHPQIRNRGTIGGSLAHADPAAELPAAVLALGGELVAAGPSGRRIVAAADFFVTFLTTALEPDEVLVELRVPPLAVQTGWGFQEFARRHGDFALAGVALSLTLDGGSSCSDARIALFGVGSTPVRATHAEVALRGEKPSPALFERAGDDVRDELEEPLSDIHASADYRRHVAGVLTSRALAEAAARAA